MTGEIADKQHHKRNQPQAVHDIRQQIARDIRRIRAQEQRVRGQAVLTEVEREDTGDILD